MCRFPEGEDAIRNDAMVQMRGMSEARRRDPSSAAAALEESLMYT